MDVQVSFFTSANNKGQDNKVFKFEVDGATIEFSYPKFGTDQQLENAQDLCYNFPDLIEQALTHVIEGGADA